MPGLRGRSWRLRLRLDAAGGCIIVFQGGGCTRFLPFILFVTVHRNGDKTRLLCSVAFAAFTAIARPRLTCAERRRRGVFFLLAMSSLFVTTDLVTKLSDWRSLRAGVARRRDLVTIAAL